MLLRLGLLCALACSPAPQEIPSGCAQHAAGDVSLPIELLAIALDAQGVPHELHDGDAVLLQAPPQGGYVIYAGAAARNLQACGARITAELLDAASSQPLTGLDQRRADFAVASGGYFWPAQSSTQLANIPSCPDNLHVGVAGRPAILRVDVVDSDLRAARVERRVTAVCPAGDARCPCMCGPNPTGC